MSVLDTESKSSIESQRQLRIEKAHTLRKLGFEPFAINSNRSFELDFVRFWFEWVQSIDVSEVVRDIQPLTIDYFLHQVLFPKNILEQAEEMLQIRQALKSMGLDPDDDRFKGKGIPEKIFEYRKLFPSVGDFDDTTKLLFLSQYLRASVNNSTNQKIISPAIVKDQMITLAGRIKSKRVSGKIAFVTLEDESFERGFQLILRSDLLAPNMVHLLDEASIPKDLQIAYQHGEKTLEMLSLDHPLTKVMNIGEVIQIKNQFYRIRNSTKFDTFIDAYGSNLDFTKILPDLPERYSLKHLEENYLAIYGEQALDTLKNGFLAYFLEPWSNSMTFDQFKELVDEGDYIEATGVLEFSRSREPSLTVKAYHILTKALRPLPSDIEPDNIEYRYLNRVADFKNNTKDSSGDGIRDLMYKKSRYWQIWREELLALDFLEVECPVFEHTPGGAEAKPFSTFYEALDQEVFLRISLELPLKKLIAGGFEKVFEIGRIFRNEGVSPQHLQEYTQMEFYWSYSEYIECMRFIQKVYRRQISELTGSLTTVDYLGHTINWGKWTEEGAQNRDDWELISGWPVVKFYDAVRYYSGGKADIEGKDLLGLQTLANELNIKFDPSDSKPRLMDLIWKKAARPQVINPIFLVLPPVELEPLAKRDTTEPHLTQRFQVVAGTAELGKGFTELNDPLDQRARFEEQQSARDAGDIEAQQLDEDYLESIEYGMPPLTGYGISERFFSFIMGKPIKELVTFPATRKIITPPPNITPSK